jgi:hypothetical protein
VKPDEADLLRILQERTRGRLPGTPHPFDRLAHRRRPGGKDRLSMKTLSVRP